MKVRVDQQKCTNPLDCRMCLGHCPENVFGVVPLQGRSSATQNRDWMVGVVQEYRCSGCKECLGLCPQGAILLN